MIRSPIRPRDNWQAKIEALGCLYHPNPDGSSYWNESAYYRFSRAEIDTLEKATNELHEMCLEAVQFVIDNDRFAELAIPPAAISAIKQAWDNSPPSIYGRFDLAFNGIDPPKMLEYNADTPTSLLEAAVIQWHWLQDIAPSSDQFNSIWEGLVEKWKELKDGRYIQGSLVHFAHADNLEDLMCVTVLRDTAQEAGLPTVPIELKDIGWDPGRGWFVDTSGMRMQTVFKLHPWEWLVHDQFGENALAIAGQMQWIEPIWKMVLSNKGILAILWEMYPGHPNLLPAYIGRSRDLVEYVRKPLLSREGGNVTIKQSSGLTRSGGEYGEEGYVFQQYCELPRFDGFYPVIGSWVVTDFGARGIGIRESAGPITTNLSSFVPHLFD